jgi:hypothetical protein
MPLPPQISRPGHRLAHAGGGEGLGQGGLVIAELAFGVELGRADHQALAGRDVGEHLARRSWTSWNEPIGLPNCVRSCAC